MKNKKTLIAIGIANLGLVFGIVGTNAFLRGESLSHIARGNDDPEPYVLTLDSSKTPNTLISSFQDNVAGTVSTALGNSISMNFVKAKSSSGKFVTLGSRGMIYTFGSEQGGISGISAVTAVFSGNSLAVRTSQTNTLVNNGVTTTGPTMLTSGTRVEIPASRFISFIGGEGNTDITSITLEYSCSDSEDVRKINGTYTGTGNDGYNYSLTLNNGVATMNSINKDTASTYTGTATWSGNNVECAFTTPEVTYNFTISADAYQLSYVNKSGSAASSAPEVTFYRFYEIENFEAYTSTGTGWDSLNNNKYAVTGFKSAYVCEYKAGGDTTGPISGQGWSLMNTDTYMSLLASGGRNGGKAGLFKTRGVELHYFHMKGYFGIPSVIGRGTKLSFWAKGPYTNMNLNEQSSEGANFTFSLYYTSQVNSSTLNQCTAQNFRVPAGNDWERFEMDLDSSKNYYAYSISTVNKVDTVRYLPIDDINIYTVPTDLPVAYATPSGNFHGYGNRSGTQDGIFLSLGSNGQAKATISDVVCTINSYTASGNNITIQTSDTKIRNITATYNPDANTLTSFRISGSLGNSWNNNGSITLSQPELTWNFDEQTVQLREIFKRRYDGGAGAQDDLIYNDDSVDAVNTNFISGDHALRLRPYSGGKGVGFKLINDFAGATAQNCNFWVYNPSNDEVKLSLWIYYMDGNTLKNRQAYDKSIVCPNGWSYHACGYTKTNNVVNFQIGWWAENGQTLPATKLLFDNISLY